MSYVTFRVVIPARLKSSRLPNKPLLDLGGKPMVVRVCERAQRSGAATIVVATDSRDVRDAVRLTVTVHRAIDPGANRL